MSLKKTLTGQFYLNKEKLFDVIMQSLDDAIMSRNQEGIVTSWNASAQYMFGYTAEEMIGSSILKLFPPERVDEEKIVLEHIAQGNHVNHVETVRMRKDGSYINVSVTLSPIFDDDGKVIGISKIVRDITEIKKMELKNRFFEAIVASTDDAIISKNMEGIVTSWNASAEYMFGYTAEEMIGYPILKLFPPERVDEEKIVLEQIAQGNRVNHFETVRMHKDGSHINVSVTLSPIFDDGKTIGVSKIVRDISERKKIEEQLRQLANTDPLTGLLNRRVFFEQLEQEIAKVARLSDYLVVLLMLDLDFFKRINDTYGHVSGDEVLKAFAEVASNNVRSVDVLARIGGEEFAILLIGADKDDAQTMAERLLEQIAKIVIGHESGSIKFTVSIGADCIFVDDMSGEAVMRRADTALYEAKERGRNQICWFSH